MVLTAKGYDLYGYFSENSSIDQKRVWNNNLFQEISSLQTTDYLFLHMYVYDMMDDNSSCHRLIDGGNRRAHFSIYRKNWIVWKSYYFSVILTLHTFHSHCRSIRRIPARLSLPINHGWKPDLLLLHFYHVSVELWVTLLQHWGGDGTQKNKLNQI